MPIDNLVQGRITEEMQELTAGYYQIESVRIGVPFLRFPNATRLSGHFLAPTTEAYDAIAGRAASRGVLVFFRKEGNEQVVYAANGTMPAAPVRYRLAAVLFAVTLVSVFITGALQQTGPDAAMTINWREGLAYALPLMAILLAHELGHFFVARHHRMSVSPPFFVPLPVVSLGTLGAVIVMTAPPKNRRQLLEMGAAGPLAGLVLAIPILLVGLAHSSVGPPPIQPYMQEGNSLLYAGLKFLMFGQFLPANGMDVQLSSLAFAGWVGLLITALNLIPAGQLDGGHAAFTLFGERIRPLTWVLIAGMIALALVTRFWGWLLWAALLFIFGQVYAVPMDDLTPLDGRHKALAVLILVLAVLLFMAVPLQVVTP